ncbi:hypothetical protein NDU88_005228 [Pleurodeles waltl]|uniref:Uncharacterized protein n=1 Tax=Pleurodeles waltl TaxID=8319 RepID=A0AAV7QH93_PLEWA|nr:hypothetical protein NDU88_005228 [Pleurodeles waltl]
MRNMIQSCQEPLRSAEINLSVVPSWKNAKNSSHERNAIRSGVPKSNTVYLRLVRMPKIAVMRETRSAVAKSRSGVETLLESRAHRVNHLVASVVSK